jgi:fermentation-respiration switch protein FrsA (DUF1100 family)
MALCAWQFGMLRAFELSQVYHPDREMEATGAELKRPFENLFFKTSDGVELNAWFYPANPNSPRKRWAILICHGNAGNISHRLQLYQALLHVGLNVFAFDYRGYGRSHGRPDEEGTYLDAQAAYHWLRHKGFAPEHIIAYGESLGGGVASELSLREKTAALVLQSTFTSIPEIGRELYPWLPVKLIGRIKYDTNQKLQHVKIPVLVMHSRTDELIGYHHSQKNFAAANEPKLFCDLQGEHNEPLTVPANFIDGMEKFLKLVEEPAATIANTPVSSK